MDTKILLVDDDKRILEALNEALNSQHRSVSVYKATDGQQAWELAQTRDYDLIILDIMLPKIDGITLCQSLRQRGLQTLILLLTARDKPEDVVKGLDAGADDYVAKPFNWQELLARVRALLRREESSQPSILKWGQLQINTDTCEVTYSGNPLTLRPKEYNILELFVQGKRKVFSCDEILDHLWPLDDSAGVERVRAHIKGLRQQLKAAGGGDLIETVYGIGYRLREDKTLEEKSLQESEEGELQTEKIQVLKEALANTWQELKMDILQEVEFLQDTSVALAEGRLNKTSLERAISEAHKLSGLLGTFGLLHSSRLASQIEDILLSPSPSGELLGQLVRELRRKLQKARPFSQDLGTSSEMKKLLLSTNSTPQFVEGNKAFSN